MNMKTRQTSLAKTGTVFGLLALGAGIVGLMNPSICQGDDDVGVGDKNPRLVDSLNQANLQSAFGILRKRYLRKDELTYEELNRSALEGLLARLGQGATLIEETDGDRPSDSELRLVSEMLTNKTVYVRPARLSGNELKSFDSVLIGFQRSPAQSLILDLRSPHGAVTFRNTPEYASRLLPKGSPLYRIEYVTDTGIPQVLRTQRKPVWTKGLVVLIDEDSSPASELLAAVLKANTNCVLIGESTRGRTVEYESVPIGRSAILRYAVAEVVLEDGSRFFGKGIQPDVERTMEREEKLAMFRESQLDGVRQFVFERERPRHNEAALVAGTNPELPAEIVRSTGDLAPKDQRSRIDPVIQAAVDVIEASSRLIPSSDEDE